MSFAEWYATVQTLSPVRRDFQLMALLTGIRSDGLMNLRWDDIDRKAGTLHVREAKGHRPYYIHLVARHLEILDRRKTENAEEFEVYGGDHGWIFPALSVSRRKVSHLAEPKQWKTTKGKKGQKSKRVKVLPGIQPLRRTFASVSEELGVAPDDRKRLVNHTISGVTEKHYTEIQDRSRYTKIQHQIAEALWERLTIA